MCDLYILNTLDRDDTVRHVPLVLYSSVPAKEKQGRHSGVCYNNTFMYNIIMLYNEIDNVI